MATSLMASRRPAAFFHPMFWAEDGAVWFAQAWNLGWAALWRPHTGYLQTVSRLTAALAVHLPLAWAPSVFVAVAWACQLAPLWYWFSPRLDSAVPDWRARWALAAAYVALPNSSEVNLNLTNAQWHLALVLFLLQWLEAPRSRAAGGRDLAVLAVGGLSGPFSVLVWPIAAWRWRRSPRTAWPAARFAVTTGAALLQAALISAYAVASRPHTPLGAAGPVLARILAGQVALGALIGMHGYARVAQSPVWHGTWGPVMVAGVCLAGMAWAAWRGPSLLRAFMAYAGLVLVAALASPAVSLTEPQWVVMTAPGAGDRYYLLPMLAWIAALIRLAGLPDNRQRALPVVALAAGLLLGVPGDWAYPPYAPDYWVTAVARFQQAPPGAWVVLPENPPGWAITLHKPGRPPRALSASSNRSG